MATSDSAPNTVLLQHPPIWGLPSSSVEAIRLQAYLTLAAVPFEVQYQSTDTDSELLPALEFGTEAAFSSTPGGPIKYLKDRKGVDLDAALQDDERADAVAFTAVAESALSDALLYELWLEPENADIAKEVYELGLPWPLVKVMMWLKKRKVKEFFEFKYGSQASADLIYDKAMAAVTSLSQRLSSKLQFFQERPSSLDAVVYSYIIFFLNAPLPKSPVKDAIVKHQNLVKFAEAIHKRVSENDQTREAPPFTRIPAQEKKQGGPKSDASKDDGKAMARRSRYFLLAQFSAIILYFLFSNTSVEISDDDDTDEADEDDDM